MDFSAGDIVVIGYYPIPQAIGRAAEVLKVRPNFVGSETWYLLRDVTGKLRAAAHPWLRRQGWDEIRAMVSSSKTSREDFMSIDFPWFDFDTLDEGDATTCWLEYRRWFSAPQEQLKPGGRLRAREDYELARLDRRLGDRGTSIPLAEERQGE